MCRWWWYKRGVENNAATFDRFYWFFGSKNFMVISFGWTMPACVCIILPFLYMPLNRTACANSNECNCNGTESLFIAVFSAFFPYFSLWYMSLVSVTACMEKIDHKFIFCTIFFTFHPKKVNDSLNFTVWWLKEPSLMTTKNHCDKICTHSHTVNADPVCQHHQKEWKPIKMRKLNK